MNPLIAEAQKHEEANRWEQALRCMTKLLQQDPKNAFYYLMAGKFLVNLQRWDEGIQSFKRAVEIEPSRFNRSGLVKHLLEARRNEEALPILLALQEEEPFDIEPTVALSHAFERLGRIDEAVELLRELHRRNPTSQRVIKSLALRLRVAGELEECIRVFQEGLPYDEGAEIASGIAFQSNYLEDISPDELFQRHVRFGQALLPGPPGEIGPRPPREKIRVGYISADFRRCAVGNFLPRFLAAHDRSQFEIYLYSDNLKHDDLSKQIQKSATVFRVTGAMDHQFCANTILADELDVLVELSGLTTSHRLMMLGYRVAPIQATYLGYCNTTGVPGVDLRFVDEWTDPPGADRWATERLVRLEGGFLCYSPSNNAPKVIPSDSNRPFTFGCFNNAAKITDQWIESIKQILDDLPESRLLVKAMDFNNAYTRNRFQQRFESMGLPMDRVEIREPGDSFADHLSAYGEVDLALDTFPYNGTTTTCESLWMGVPVVVFPGQTHRERVGLSLMNSAGLPQFIASDRRDWIELAKGWAGKRPELADLRQGMREHLEASDLLNGERLARALERAYRSACDR